MSENVVDTVHIDNLDIDKALSRRFLLMPSKQHSSGDAIAPYDLRYAGAPTGCLGAKQANLT
jgi:hypothetical protein